MPTAPLQPCSHQPCRNTVTHGACAEHRRAKHRMIDDRRGTAKERGYDVAYRKIRVLIFDRDHWTCMDCGWRPELLVECERVGLDQPDIAVILDYLAKAQQTGERHLHCDHVIPIADAPDMRLSAGNLATRCSTCHAVKTAREDGGFGHAPVLR